jgi:hypothetical protein
MQKLFENWRQYRKDTLEEMAQAAAIGQRVATAARPYLNRIGRAISTKAPTWFKSAPKTGADLTIKYGPTLNKIMGSDATGIIRYLHPNAWWAETVMRVASRLGPLYQPAFKLMYGSLMTWNAIKQPAVIATGGNWLFSHLRDPETEKEFDSPNAAIADHLQQILEEGATEEEVIEYLKDVIKLKDTLQPVPKTSSEKEIPPKLKPGAMPRGPKI